MEQELNNFINVRLKTYNHTKQYNLIKHNLRKILSLSQINDLKKAAAESGIDLEKLILDTDELDSVKDLFKNNLKQQHLGAGNKFIDPRSGMAFDLNSESMIDMIYNNLSKMYQADRHKHNELFHDKNKRNLKNEKATWCEGVFTFSEQMKLDLGTKYSEQDIIDTAVACLKDIADFMGAEPIALYSHKDETCFHFHWQVSNYDKDGLSLFHKINNTASLSKIQDIGFAHFGKLGMKRGISKADRLKQGLLDNINHKSIQAFHEQNLIGIIKNIKLESNNLNFLKNTIKETEKFLNLKSIEQTIVQTFMADFHKQATQALGYDTTAVEIKEILKDIQKSYSNLDNQLQKVLIDSKTLKQNLTNEINDLRLEKKEILSDIETTKEQKFVLLSEKDLILKDKIKLKNEIKALELDLKKSKAEQKTVNLVKNKVFDLIESNKSFGFVNSEKLAEQIVDNFSFLEILATNKKQEITINQYAEELKYYKKLQEFGDYDQVIKNNRKLSDTIKEKNQIIKEKDLKFTAAEQKILNQSVIITKKTAQIDLVTKNYNRYKNRIRTSFNKLKHVEQPDITITDIDDVK